ncbi:MAG: hypothetical protein NXI04_03300 [Planctomycetaceae bacterium]|nr:hypothetical protein [Planctomycetaceae bacterium]
MMGEVFRMLFGFSVFVGLMYGIWKANARRWTRLARVYKAANPGESMDAVSKRMQTVILTGGHLGYNSYKGIATVSVTGEGLLFRMMPLFSIFHPPLLIPFRDISIAPKKWYVIGKTFQFTFAGVHNVQMIVHSELVEWIEAQTRELALNVPDVGVVERREFESSDASACLTRM